MAYSKTKLEIYDKKPSIYLSITIKNVKAYIKFSGAKTYTCGDLKINVFLALADGLCCV
jgi:hypothetical protein